MSEPARRTRTARTRPPKAVKAVASPRGSLDTVVLDSIFTMNSGGVIQSASDSVESVFGWTPTELYGRNFSELVPEPRRTELDRYLDRYRKPGPPKALTRSQRFDALRKDGTRIQIELSLSRADLPALASSYFVGIVRDVSRTIDIDTDPMVGRSHLQQLVTEQTRALATAHLQLLLADRLSTLGTLSAGLGHDIHNVLLPVRARLNALEDSGLSDAALSHVAVVRSAVAHLQYLCDGLHYLAPERESLEEASERDEPTSLQSWWSQVGPLIRLVIPSGTAFVTSFEPGLPQVTIAPHWLTQAVLNLVVNAGEALSTRRRRPCVRLTATLADNGQTVSLSIMDNGRGMTHAVARRAFDLFFTTKTRQAGTGLGLPLARKVVVRAGGSVEISSRPGKGTTVLITLPVVPRRVLVGKSEAARVKGPMAAVGVKGHRLAALYSQVLLAAGISVRSAGASGTSLRGVDVWLTPPVRGRLELAARWLKRNQGRIVVSIGQPRHREIKRWTDLGALIITEPASYVAIRAMVLKISETLGTKPAL